ncbi:hypothetical protein TNCV_2114971 [Trichonephila clavipes]|nr:hypothetical protein TNCV_2114971 [Trichonephila clavipes]
MYRKIPESITLIHRIMRVGASGGVTCFGSKGHIVGEKDTKAGHLWEIERRGTFLNPILKLYKWQWIEVSVSCLAEKKEAKRCGYGDYIGGIRDGR